MGIAAIYHVLKGNRAQQDDLQGTSVNIWGDASDSYWEAGASVGTSKAMIYYNPAAANEMYQELYRNMAGDTRWRCTYCGHLWMNEKLTCATCGAPR